MVKRHEITKTTYFYAPDVHPDSKHFQIERMAHRGSASVIQSSWNNVTGQNRTDLVDLTRAEAQQLIDLLQAALKDWPEEGSGG